MRSAGPSVNLCSTGDCGRAATHEAFIDDDVTGWFPYCNKQYADSLSRYYEVRSESHYDALVVERDRLRLVIEDALVHLLANEPDEAAVILEHRTPHAR
jgi:hypothetical protein